MNDNAVAFIMMFALFIRIFDIILISWIIRLFFGVIITISRGFNLKFRNVLK